jgi:hypothetical protein
VPSPTLADWILHIHRPIAVLKLDCKELLAIQPALTICAQYSKVIGTVWLNADILQGPRGRHPQISLGQLLLAADSALPHSAVLSLGWTTGDIDSGDIGYTTLQIEEMEQYIERYLDRIGTHREITLALRGIDLVYSIELFKELLERNNKFSITVWVGKEGLDHQLLRNVIIPAFEQNRLYIDVPGWEN